MADEILGWEGELAVKVADAFVPIPDAKDVTVNRTGNEVNVTTRGSAGQEDTAVSSIAVGIDAEVLLDISNTGLLALQTAYRARSKVEVRALDKSGGKGFSMMAVVTSFSLNQPLEGEQTVSVSIKKARGAAITWIDGS